jgi:hypothetical protein
MIWVPVVIDRAQFVAIDELGGPGGGVPGQPGDLLDGHPRWLIKLTNEVRSSRGVQPSPISTAAQTRLNIFRTLSASRAVPWSVVNISPVSCHRSPP